MTRKLNKKGSDATYSTLATSFTTVLTIVILIGGIVLLSTNTLEAATLETCRDSVIVRDNANIEIKGVEIAEKATPLLCKTDDVKVLTGNREEIKEQIADLSAQCWFMYVEGRVADIFKVDHGDKGCNICYFFQIDEVKEDTPIDHPVDETKGEGRPENKITSAELYNYLMNTRYDAPLIRGGGYKNIISDEYKLSTRFLEFEQKQHLGATVQEIELLDIRGTGITSFVKDFSGFFDNKTKKEIDREIGAKLLKEHDISLLVIVAETFDTLERSDSRLLYEKLGLNSEEGKYDGILVLADIQEGKIRVIMGKELDVYLLEPDIEDLIRDSVKTKAGDSTVNVSEAVQEVVNRIGSKILNEEKYILFNKYGINPKSYYAYMNNGINYPLIVDDLQSGLAYSISYMSSSDSASAMENLEIASIVSGAMPTPGGPGSELGGLLGVFFLAETGLIDTDYKQPNHILIARSTKGQKYCEVME